MKGHTNATARQPKGTLAKASRSISRGPGKGKRQNTTKAAPKPLQNIKTRGHF